MSEGPFTYSRLCFLQRPYAIRNNNEADVARSSFANLSTFVFEANADEEKMKPIVKKHFLPAPIGALTLANIARPPPRRLPQPSPARPTTNRLDLRLRVGYMLGKYVRYDIYLRISVSIATVFIPDEFAPRIDKFFVD